MHTLLALTLSLAPQGTCEGFEHNNEALWVAASPGEDTLDLHPDAAAVGALGARFGAATAGASWRARYDLQSAPGDVYSCHVRVRGTSATPAELGRVSFGVGATVDGALVATLAPDTGELMLQAVSGWTTTTSVTTLASAPASIAADTWYTLQLLWYANGDTVLDLATASGVSVAQVTAPTNFVTPGGFALFGATGAAGVYLDLDELCLDFQIDPVFTTYCAPAALNSTGTYARLSLYGSPILAANDLELVATQLPPGSFGFFITSRTQALIPMPGGSQGNLCVGGTIGRFTAQIFNGGPIGRGTALIDLTAIPTPTGTVSAHAGETWNFQAWYRDANPGVTSNFSEAIAVPIG